MYQFQAKMFHVLVMFQCCSDVSVMFQCIDIDYFYLSLVIETLKH